MLRKLLFLGVILLVGCTLLPSKSVVGQAAADGSCDFEWFHDIKGIDEKKVYT